MAVDLSNLKRQVVDDSRRRVDRAVSRMTDDLKTTAPVDTGELRRKTGVEVTSVTPQGIKAVAEIDVSYAEVVTMGSRPHPIVARPGKTLAFRWPKRGGALVFFKSVNHPGTKANDFYQKVIDRWSQYLQSS